MGDPLVFIELSYPINAHYPGEVLGLPGPEISWRAKFGDGQGKSNQTSSLCIFNHYGTHIDTPLHLFHEGKTVADYEITDFIFSSPLLLQLPKTELQQIASKDLENAQEMLSQTDLLLIYTGFSKYRFTDVRRYVNLAPGFSEEGARWLVSHFPNIRAVGIDCMSVENIPHGRRIAWPVHKILLGSRPDFLAIEDMNLTPVIGKQIKQVIVAPLRIQAEASPTTVIAEVDHL